MLIFGGVSEYRCITTVILYALSILVRYRPSIWREVASGKYEDYLALTDEFLSVFERLAPEKFLEALLDSKVRVVQSGSMFAHI
ncbi:YaaC family protein [Morganella morganii]|uniref:YaaC family protein n=1 Tax=Morganella morganii TaxID=582 RepID=UPI003D6E6131